MARLINRLSARQVELASAPGRYGDGAGLHLVVGANGRKQWVFRYRLLGTRRDMGLGAAGKGGVPLPMPVSSPPKRENSWQSGEIRFANGRRTKLPSRPPELRLASRRSASSLMRW